MPAGPSPFLFGLVSIALLTVMDALVKHLSAAYPTLQILTLRFALTVVWVLPLLIWQGIELPRADRLKAHGVRAVLMLVANGCFFYALGRLPFAEVFALSFTGPLFVALFGALFLRERIAPAAAVSILAGFAGMLLIVLGASAGSVAAQRSPLALGAALTAPLVYALSITLLKSQASREHPVAIVVAQSLIVALASAPLAAVDWQPPTPADWSIFALIGGLSAAGYLLLVAALAGMSSVRYAVVEYTGLVWAALIGFFAFAEIPGAWLWAGAALIVAGCLVMARDRDATKAATAP